MLANDYLTFVLVRLKHSEAWPNQGQGITVVLANGGNGRYVCGTEARDLSPGDVVVLNSLDKGKITVTGDEMAFWWFSVCFDHLFPLFAVGEICLLQDMTENLKDSKHYSASSPLAQECHRLVAAAPPQGNVDHRSQVIRVAAAVLSAEFKTARHKRVGFVRIEDHMMQVFEALSPADLLTLSVGDMAHKFSCSRRHLNRLFHQHFGCSVASLRMEMRLLKALSLLRDPNVKIIHVAEQCGFNHLGLFNACFKKRFGNTPGQWRKGGAHSENEASHLNGTGLSCPMHAKGLCALVPQKENESSMGRKPAPVQRLNPKGAPANSKLREAMIRNVREVTAQMASKSSSGLKLRKCA
jgi:AraC-like DNA-binding protein